MKQNQIIAVAKSTKETEYRKFTELHKLNQKPAAFNGFVRTYQPRDEEGDMLPPEQQIMQAKVGDVLKEAKKIIAKLFDVVATQEWGNLSATADITVDDKVVLPKVPVTYLLFLEKQLVDIHSFVKEFPRLDPAERWSYDPNAGCYNTEPTMTNRTKKVPRALVLYEATKEHPAQVQTYNEDVIIGQYKTIKMSGALPADHVIKFLERVEKLQAAVKFAREQANSVEVAPQSVGEKIFEFIFE